MPIDYSRYPPNWNELRALVLERAQNCCEVCKVANGAMVWQGRKKIHKEINGKKRLVYRTFRYESEEAGLADKAYNTRLVKIVLTIAHLDHDETNWNVPIERLQAMCQLDHLQYDAKEKYRRIMQKAKQQ